MPEQKRCFCFEKIFVSEQILNAQSTAFFQSELSSLMTIKEAAKKYDGYDNWNQTSTFFYESFILKFKRFTRVM